MQKLAFQISSEGIVETFRNFVIEDQWQVAFESLTEDILGADDKPALTTDQALSILRGTLEMQGTNTFELVERTDNDYVSRLRYHFGGCYRTREGRHMQPYAIVTSWGADDYGYEGDRSLFYADNRKSQDTVDQVKIGEQICHVLFREIQNFPSLIVAAHRTAQEAVEDFLRDRTLRVYGYLKTFEDFLIKEETPYDQQPTLRKSIYYLLDDEEFQGAMDYCKRLPKGDLRTKIEDEILKGMADAGDHNHVDIIRELKYFREDVDRERNTAKNLTEWTAKIIEQAGDNFFDLVYDDEGEDRQVWRIPRAPFENWALECRMNPARKKYAADWTPISASGYKCIGDDPYHTDWMLGGNIPFGEWNPSGGSPLIMAAIDERGRLQRERLNYKITILAGAGMGKVEGQIVHLKPKQKFSDVVDLSKGPYIGVIKNAGPDYVFAAQEAIENGFAIITEQGGITTHLVTAFIDKPLRMVRIPGAFKDFGGWQMVTLDFVEGTIEQ